MDISVRKAADKDADIIISYIKKLAEFEDLSESCKLTPDGLIELMNEPNGLGALIAEADGKPVGMMLYYFFRIATFSGKRVMYIEDVYIDEDMRRHGIGGILFDTAKNIAKEKDCTRLEWKCLDWNKNAIGFYKRIGGKTSDGWLTYTIDKDNF